MFTTISNTIKYPTDYPSRTKRLTVLAAVRDGKLYDDLDHEFDAERDASGNYIPIRKRKPSVRYNLCRLVVEDSVSFLFGEGRWPAVECADRATQDSLALALEESRLADVMARAAMEGSIGSVVVLMRVLGNRVFWTVKPTALLTPAWKPEAPDTLLSVTERRRVRGSDLVAAGYAVPEIDLTTTFWWQIQWGEQAETWFVPWKTSEPDTFKPQEDAGRTVQHGLGFVPAVWIKNLPGSSTDDENDGWCTFQLALDTSVEIDYQLSQAGRGLKYSSDPLLLVKEPAAGGDDIIRSASSALVVDKDGDAKLLEIGGSAAAAVIEYVKALREMALESVHGNRSSADKISAAQSGRAMELLYAPLINLADRLRVSYGQAILKLARMVVLAHQRYPLTAFGEGLPEMVTNKRLTLRWPPYFAETHQDKRSEAEALGMLRREGMISQPTAVARTAAVWDVGDAAAELAAIKVDEAAADARAKARGDQFQDRQTLPA